jgi:glutaredoxin-like protein
MVLFSYLNLLIGSTFTIENYRMQSLEQKQKEINQYLENKITNPVSILVIGQNHSQFQHPRYGEFDPFLETIEIAHLISSFQPLISYKVIDQLDLLPCANFFRIERLPAVILLGNSDHGIRFYGFPLGYDLISFLDTIIDFSIGAPHLQTETVRRLQSIKSPIHIKVFVNPSCIFCPVMSHLSNQFALVSSYIYSDSIDAWYFQEIAKAYNVKALPTTVINEKVKFTGAITEEELLEYIIFSTKR